MEREGGANDQVIRSLAQLKKTRKESEISAQEISKNLPGNLKIENSFLWANAESQPDIWCRNTHKIEMKMIQLLFSSDIITSFSF